MNRFPLEYPTKGLNTTASPHAFPEGSAPDLVNVRPFDPLFGQLRGGSRLGLGKWSLFAMPGPVQTMTRVTGGYVFPDPDPVVRLTYEASLDGNAVTRFHIRRSIEDVQSQLLLANMGPGLDTGMTVSLPGGESAVALATPDDGGVSAGTLFGGRTGQLALLSVTANFRWVRDFRKDVGKGLRPFWLGYDPATDCLLLMGRVDTTPVGAFSGSYVDNWDFDVPTAGVFDFSNVFEVHPSFTGAVFLMIERASGEIRDKFFFSYLDSNSEAGLFSQNRVDAKAFAPGKILLRVATGANNILAVTPSNTDFTEHPEAAGTIFATETGGYIDVFDANRMLYGGLLAIDLVNRQFLHRYSELDDHPTSFFKPVFFPGAEDVSFLTFSDDDFRTYAATATPTASGAPQFTLPPTEVAYTYTNEERAPNTAIPISATRVLTASRYVLALYDLTLGGAPLDTLATQTYTINDWFFGPEENGAFWWWGTTPDADTFSVIYTRRTTTEWFSAFGEPANMFRFDVNLLDDTLSIAWTRNFSDATDGAMTLSFSYVDPATGTVDVDTSAAVLAVSDGNVYATTSDNQLDAADGDDAISDVFGQVQMQHAFSRVFIVDGTSTPKVYTYDTNTIEEWPDLLTNGTLVSGAKLITLYRGRIVLSGVPTDPHNWFMSKAGDPFDFEYGSTITTPVDAVAGNLSPAGLVGDLVTALIPLNDDIMIFGCSSSIWQMSGDPMAGGAIDLVSDQTGITYGRAWAKDPENVLYFAGIDGIYSMPMGGRPSSLTTGRLDQEFVDVDLERNRYLLAWDFRRKGLLVLRVPLNNTSPVVGYFWDQRTDSWWRDSYPAEFGPCSVLTYDSSRPNDADLLLGCRDGYIRRFSPLVTDDDGHPLPSRLVFPYVVTPDTEQNLNFHTLDLVLAEGSQLTEARVRTGQTADQVQRGVPVKARREFLAGRSPTWRPRVSGHVITLELASLGTWGLERMDGEVTALGPVRPHRRAT